ncbi:hypothetical protein GCM10007242_48910 [Pigmentiphaga litoralis]|jgi:hypothetical protein|uniref:hypothetical protein n=1 Tax=Pigmentiphaga litoralis TaxID=516702 RepID=UPI00167C3CA8|nr:hypothetical protein [Pigmentiphaga litoralis]GGX35909.1 hypothetical protein GCM10007242_48910 [Pigmentiphaga litoralis]
MSALDPMIFHPSIMNPLMLMAFAILAYLAGVATAAWWFRHGRRAAIEQDYRPEQN